MIDFFFLSSLGAPCVNGGEVQYFEQNVGELGYGLWTKRVKLTDAVYHGPIEL